MPTYLSIRETAQRIGVRPRDLSDAIYHGRLTTDHYDYIAGRKVFREDRLDRVSAVIKRRREQTSRV